MTREEVEQELRQIVTKLVDVSDEELEDCSTFSSIGADSLDRVEILITIEEKYHIDIKDEDAEKVATFGDLVDLTMKTIGEGTN